MILAPSECRPGHRCPVVNAKEALHCDVHHGTRPANGMKRVEYLAALTGISASVLYKFSNPFETDQHIPSRHLPVLIPHLTNHRLLDFYEQLAGRVAFEVPTGTPSDAETAAVVKEFGEFLVIHAEAGADRRYTEQEALEVARQGIEAIAKIAALIEHVQRTVTSEVRR